MEQETEKIMEVLNNRNLDFKESLEFLSTISDLNVSFSTSFGMEDQVITHLISSVSPENIKIFTLDTGRLFQETYSVWSSTLQRYSQIKIKAFYPDNDELSAYVTDNGVNAFYESMELRKQCCNIRKVVPLKKALAGVNVWITGVRGEASNGRSDIPKASWDESFQLIKYNPLIDWTLDDVKKYIKVFTKIKSSRNQKNL